MSGETGGQRTPYVEEAEIDGDTLVLRGRLADLTNPSRT